jgi:hypothetical protein
MSTGRSSPRSWPSRPSSWRSTSWTTAGPAAMARPRRTDHRDGRPCSSCWRCSWCTAPSRSRGTKLAPSAPELMAGIRAQAARLLHRPLDAAPLGGGALAVVCIATFYLAGLWDYVPSSLVQPQPRVSSSPTSTTTSPITSP